MKLGLRGVTIMVSSGDGGSHGADVNLKKLKNKSLHKKTKVVIENKVN